MFIRFGFEFCFYGFTFLQKYRNLTKLSVKSLDFVAIVIILTKISLSEIKVTQLYSLLDEIRQHFV